MNTLVWVLLITGPMSQLGVAPKDTMYMSAAECAVAGIHAQAAFECRPMHVNLFDPAGSSSAPSSHPAPSPSQAASGVLVQAR